MSLLRMTPAKLAANRANAKISTGPRTDWLAIIRRDDFASTNPYLVDSTTPPLAMRAAASRVPQASEPRPVGIGCDFASTNPYLVDSTTQPNWPDTS